MRSEPAWRLYTQARLLLRGLRYAPLLPIAALDGGLTVNEAIQLYELSRALPHEQPIAVDVGGQGQSSVCLARGLSGKFRPRLCCVGVSADHGVTPIAPAGLQHDGGRTTHAATRGAASTSHVDVRLAEAALALDWRTPIDLLFVDGGEPGVRETLAVWAKHVRPGGFLAVRQPAAMRGTPIGPGVDADANWVETRSVDNLFVARRTTH